MAVSESTLQRVLDQSAERLLGHWMQAQLSADTIRRDLIDEAELRRQSEEFLGGFRHAVAAGETDDIRSPLWENARATLQEISSTRAQQGFSPSETATFVFSLKEPLLREFEQSGDDGIRVEEIWEATRLLDKLGLYTTELYQQTREAVIRRQQQEILELSTPVVKLWDGVVAVPLIGTLDSERTQVVMENLLQMIIDTGAGIAIIDITGVPTVDTLVAQHLIKTVAAARLMGAECIISGIRPQIAQTIVHLGIELQDVTTKASLGDAIRLAFDKLGLEITRRGG
jgi:rsbT co-antagonist protein RsbR